MWQEKQEQMMHHAEQQQHQQQQAMMQKSPGMKSGDNSLLTDADVDKLGIDVMGDGLQHAVTPSGPATFAHLGPPPMGMPPGAR